MQQRDFYRTEVATAPLEAPVRTLADLMAHYAIGSVVILDGDGRAVGIVTDRDLALRVIARGLDPTAARAADVMSKPLVVAAPDDGVETVIERMRGAGVRRLPVVRDGRLTGLVAMDDLLVELGRELDDIGEAVRREVLESRSRGRRERRREEIDEAIAKLRGQVERLGEEAREFLGREFEALRERVRGPRSK